MVVLADGRIVETGFPEKLLRDEQSAFYRMYSAAAAGSPVLLKPETASGKLVEN